MHRTALPLLSIAPQLMVALLMAPLLAQTFGPPSGGFVVPIDILQPGPMAAGDFDGDGDQDVVAAAFFVPLVFYRNDGEGRFVRENTNALTLSGQTSVSSLTATDIDGDGDQDVLVAMSQTVGGCAAADRLLRNNGTGTFTETALGSVLDNTSRLLPVDIDQDGDRDVVCTSFGTIFCNVSPCRILRNDGAAGFTDVTAQLLPATPIHAASVAALDVQNDGRMDLVFDGAPLQVLLQAPNGTFAPNPNIISVPVTGVQAADIDGDQDVDLFGYDGALPIVLRNDGFAVFSSWTGPPCPPDMRAIVPGDIDGDGDLDLLLDFGPTSAPTGIRLWRQDPGTQFTDVSATHLGGTTESFRDALFLDSDGDQDLDLFHGKVGVLHNDGAGHLLRLEPWPLLPPASRGCLIDVDADGFLDVVGIPLVNGSGAVPLGWWRNDRGDQFVFAAGLGVSTNGLAIVRIDIDGDGDQDVFTSGPRLLRNDGNASFTDVTAASLPAILLMPPPTNHLVQVAIPGDFDLDGDLDLFVGHGPQFPASTQDTLLRNNGSGVFTNVGPGNLTDPDNTNDAEAFDLEGDGDLDLVIASTASTLRMFRNNGAGSFTDVTTAVMPTNLLGRQVLAVDVDGDGDQDLVLGNVAGSGRLLRNDAGVFTNVSSQLPATTSSIHPGAGDFDSDGDVDLNLNGQWLVNNGAGTFALSAAPAFYPVDGKRRFEDTDGDGDPDWLGMHRNLHRQLENALPPRVGLHAEVRMYAQSSQPGWAPLALLAFALGPAATPVPIPPFGTLQLDPATMIVHSAHVIPASGSTVHRFLCPSSPTLLGAMLWSQALIAHGAAGADWRLTNTVMLAVLR